MTDLMIESFPAGVVADGFRPLQCVTVASADPNVLLHIRRPEVNLAIWHRDTSAIFTPNYLRNLTKSAPFTAVAHSLSEFAVDRLSKQVPARLSGDLLWDLTDLTLVFATINDGSDEPVRIRLDAERQAPCSRWQANATGLRMQCTYCGPGIEWLPCDGGETEAAMANACSAHGSPTQMATGAVAILKGGGYPGNAGHGCIHRSSQIALGSGVRLQVVSTSQDGARTNEARDEVARYCPVGVSRRRQDDGPEPDPGQQ